MKTTPCPAARLGAALALLSLCGCADGGPIGTGIAASVAGNVVAVVEDSAEFASATASPAALAGAVTVEIAGLPGSATTTDGNGNFVVDGNFAGPIVLAFSTANLSASIDLNVPAGGVLLLADVAVAPDGVAADARREIGYEARLVAADCAGDRLAVTEDATGSPREIALSAETAITRRDGRPIACSGLRRGERLRIDGAIGDSGDLHALSVVAGGTYLRRRAVIEGVRFAGFVLGVDCARGLLRLADETSIGVLLLGANTSITGPDGADLACADLSRGQRISGHGQVRIARPNRIAARAIALRPAAGGAPTMRLSGSVAAIDCAASLVDIDDGSGVRVAVRLDGATRISGAKDCAAIEPGWWLFRGLVRFDPARPGNPPVAATLHFRRPDRTAADTPNPDPNEGATP